MAEKKNPLQIYNACRELVTQAEKSAEKNGGKVDESLLPPLKSMFHEIVEFEKKHLIMAHDVLYGSILLNMETDIDFTVRAPIDIDIRKEPLKMLFNPMFIAHLTYAEFTGMVIMEILKLIDMHPATFAKMNSIKDPEVHKMLEKSSEASVANLVQNDIRLDKRSSKNLVLPKNVYTPTKLAAELGVNPKKDQALEYYYKILKNFNKGDENQSENPDPQGQESQNGVATTNNNQGKQPHQWYDEKSEDVKDKIKSMIAEVYRNMDEKTRGTIPGAIEEKIKALLKKPEISWKDLLRKYVGVIPVPHRSTKMRLNRRQPERADLSGQLPKRHIELVVAIDTSGSMSSSDIAYVINEIFNIVKDYDSKITIIECDAEIGKVYEAKRASDVQTKVTGRGGTSFIPVIEYINKSNKYKNALMIYFTDGYGDSEIPRPRTFRNMWVVLQDEKYLSLKEPYGEVKALRKDADWINSVGNGGN
jgi:predicted metal-dependent peptidase